jgi:UDP-N-acetylbacillosamine N-acetyltransferase
VTALVLLGAGGHARSVADVADRAGSTVVTVVDPNGAPGWDLTVVASPAQSSPTAGYLVCIGDNHARERATRELEELGRPLATLVATSATVASAVGAVGVGSQVLEHAHVGPGATLGRGVIVNTRATVEHDCAVGDFAHIAPAATLLGGVTVGRCTLVGAGATILPGVQVGPEAVIAAGAVVVRDVAARQVVRGVPGRPHHR